MWIREFLCGLIGFASGIAVAGGVFALITSIGIIPRISDKTHTKHHLRAYELSILLGGTLGNIYNIFEVNFPGNDAFNAHAFIFPIFGIAAGIFVGCLATALAESLNVTAITSRRLKLHVGLGFIILSLALGKLIGSFIFFYNRWF